MSIQKAFQTDHITGHFKLLFESYIIGILIHHLQHLDCNMLHPQKKVNISYLTYFKLIDAEITLSF